MFKRVKSVVSEIWSWFRRRSIFVQLLLVIPVICAVAVTVIVGNVGLALMGTAVALSAPIVGWLVGFFALILAKAGAIIAKDWRRSR